MPTNSASKRVARNTSLSFRLSFPQPDGSDRFPFHGSYAQKLASLVGRRGKQLCSYATKQKAARLDSPEQARRLNDGEAPDELLAAAASPRRSRPLRPSSLRATATSVSLLGACSFLSAAAGRCADPFLPSLPWMALLVVELGEARCPGGRELRKMMCIFCSRIMMLPPIHGPCEKLAALDICIRDSWSAEELVRFLAERKAEDPLPLDVMMGVDCSVLDPRCFTGCIEATVWHLKLSDDQEPYDSAENGIRNAKNGYWKPLGSSRIPTSTAIIGVKIVLEFYEGQAPCGKRTGWMMHEYRIEQNDEANLPQDYKSLCKVFLQSDKNTESGQNSLNANAPNDTFESYLQYLAKIEEPKDTVSANEDDTSSTGQHEQKTQSAADDVIATGDYLELNDLIGPCIVQHEQNTENAADGICFRDDIATDDYIELNDLLNSEASSSTSESTSKRSLISEEYFDSDAFLRVILEDSNIPDEQHRDHKFSIAAPTKSANVVINPTEQGLVHIHGDNAPVAGTSQQKRVPGGDGDQHSSKERQQQSSSISSCFPTSHVKRSHSDGSDSSQSSMKPQKMRPNSKFGKIGKKYFCFGSF
ncbi:hypothetical protein EJB05_22397, partial [Eragrostis curvula]